MDSIFVSADKSQVAAITPLGYLSGCNISATLSEVLIGKTSSDMVLFPSWWECCFARPNVNLVRLANKLLFHFMRQNFLLHVLVLTKHVPFSVKSLFLFIYLLLTIYMLTTIRCKHLHTYSSRLDLKEKLITKSAFLDAIWLPFVCHLQNVSHISLLRIL